MNPITKNLLWGAALLVVPGSSVLVGGYLIYKGIQRLTKGDEDGKCDTIQTTTEFVGKLRENIDRPATAEDPEKSGGDVDQNADK